jgi:hypothetical protein
LDQGQKLSELRARRAAAATLVNELETKLDRYDHLQLRHELVEAVRLVNALDRMIAAAGGAAA